MFEKFGNASLKNIWIMPESLFERTNFNSGCSDQYELFLRDTLKQTVSI